MSRHSMIQRAMSPSALRMKYAVAVLMAIHVSVSRVTWAADEAVLPGTTTLTWEDHLSERMMDGLHRFIEHKIAGSVKKRPQYWQRDFRSGEAYDKSVEPNRQRLKRILGVTDARLPPRMEHFSDDDNRGLVAETETYFAFTVRWPVLDGVTGEGLLLEPKIVPKGYVVALPDADQTPEDISVMAFDKPLTVQFAARLADNGFRVIVPTLIDRSDEFSGNANVAWTNQTHREWIYRQAYQMGRHVIGYEVQKVLAAIDWLDKTADVIEPPIGVVGYGEGGLIALYAAAIDTRIDAALISGYFEPHAEPWTEPLYRNIWSLQREFGDAEVASLIAPRGLVVEYSRGPEVPGPPPVREGRRGGAALGKLTTPSLEAVQAEFKRLEDLLQPGFGSRHLVHGKSGEPVGPGSVEAITHFVQLLGMKEFNADTDTATADTRKHPYPPDRQRRQVRELEDHVQKLLRGADRTRDEFFLSKILGKQPELASWMAKTPKYKEYFADEVLGRFDDEYLPLNPRSRKIYDRPKWTGYDVVLDVYPDVFAWGVLLVPKGIAPGEQRPVVVCQHGRNGLPKDTIEGDHRAYHDYAAKLADRGFIVFAPHNPYRGEDRYRFLSRKANSVKASLFSFILAQHEQILRWLATLPEVDPDRIAFYGLSYGGETAVRVPPLLDGYCLSICSADFNDWARKVASTDSQYSFMFTIEWEMPYFDLGSKFNYAEMVYMLAPRPFMVERGHADGVAPDEWVAYEYAKVRRLYDQLGIGDRTEIEFFDGPHTIHGVGTFKFLHKHLNWPEK